ncbi:hypothetical protein NM208_g10856 [Fusarium decemcellulare]|uniref:Uncharacterized protein n=1 Tax=Fusarium decemcellulare TaxID=57161 RepID=A0ACC1RWE3_9HYPO|nr:hypothetical protein NM208_g10856 [Fusarium decemcellulare]
MMDSTSSTQTLSVPDIQAFASHTARSLELLQTTPLDIEAVATTEPVPPEVAPAQPEGGPKETSDNISEQLREAINHAVDVPLSSPSVHQYGLNPNLWFGTEDMIPQVLKKQWTCDPPIGIKRRLDDDLKPTRGKMRGKAARRGLPRSESDINTDLRMSGFRSSSRQQHVTLSPRLWIFCGSDWAVKGVLKALKGIRWITDLIPVEVCNGGPEYRSLPSLIPMEQLSSLAEAEHSLQYGGGQVLYHIAKLRPELASSSICGWLCCATYMKSGKIVSQRVSRIGGMLTSQMLDNQEFPREYLESAMTTAHGIFDCLDFGDDNGFNCDTDSDNDDSEIDEEVDEWRLKKPRETNASFSGDIIGGTNAAKASSEWIAFDTIPTVNFFGHCRNAQTLEHHESPVVSDYVLLKTEALRLLHNSYLLWRPDSGAPRVQVINTYSTKQELLPGPIWLILGFDNVEQGSLLPGKSTVHLGGREIAVQKVQLRAPLAQGTSGAWLARDNTFCGMVIAAHAGEPLGLVITAQDIFSDLKYRRKAVFRTKEQVPQKKSLAFIRDKPERPQCQDMAKDSANNLADHANKFAGRIRALTSLQIGLNVLSILAQLDPIMRSPNPQFELLMMVSTVAIIALTSFKAPLQVGQKQTYNSGDSLVVTDPTTNPPLTGLTMGEQTGSRILQRAEVDHNNEIPGAAMTSRCPAGPASTESGPARRRLSKRPGSSRPSVIGTNTWGVGRYATGG